MLFYPYLFGKVSHKYPLPTPCPWISLNNSEPIYSNKKMVNESLVDWLKDGLSKGYSPDQLKAILSEKGLDASEVDWALGILAPAQEKQEAFALAPLVPASKSRSKPNKFKWAGISLVAVILFAGIFFAVTSLQKGTISAAPPRGETPATALGETPTIDEILNKLAMTGFSLGEKEDSIWQTSSPARYYNVFGAKDGARLKINGVEVELYRFEDKKAQKNAASVFTRAGISAVVEKGNVVLVIYSTDSGFVSKVSNALA